MKVRSGKKKLTTLVGHNLRQRRLETGLTQTQVAEALSVEVETISRYERGVLSPSLVQLERLAHILATPTHLLLSSEGTSVEETEEGLAFQLNSLAPEHRAFLAGFIRDYVALNGTPVRDQATKQTTRPQRKAKD